MEQSRSAHGSQEAGQGAASEGVPGFLNPVKFAEENSLSRGNQRFPVLCCADWTVTFTSVNGWTPLLTRFRFCKKLCFAISELARDFRRRTGSQCKGSESLILVFKTQFGAPLHSVGRVQVPAHGSEGVTVATPQVLSRVQSWKPGRRGAVHGDTGQAEGADMLGDTLR